MMSPSTKVFAFLLVALCTFTAAVDPAEGGCAKQTTCQKCIIVKGATGTVCVFNTLSGECVGKSVGIPAANSAKTNEECTLYDKALAQDIAAATSEWEKIKPHVFGTEKGLKNTSGRHLASSFISVPANKNLPRTANAETGISIFQTQGGKPKTTWDDDLGEYTPEQVEAMCIDAIRFVLKTTKSKTLPKSGTQVISVSVRSPRNMNLCISVQGNVSAYPGSTHATDATPGTVCNPDAGASDDS